MKWASAFKYLSINYDTCVATVQNRTQRVSFDNNLNGDRVRLRFSNRYAKKSLRLDRVTIGVMSGDRVVHPVPVTLAGERVITLEPGQETFSDEISFTVCAGERLAVNIYIGEEQSIENICGLWARTNTLVSFGAEDCTDGQAFDEAQLDNILPLIRDDTSPDKMMFFYGFNALQVYTEDDVKVVAVFGDSITHMSYVTNALGKRMYAAYPGKVTLINSGIGGNRLVHDATYIEEIHQVVSVFGDAGVKRFERDIFEIDDVDSVLALIGINDIMHPIQLEGKPETTPPEEIIDGYRTIARLTHGHNAKIYGATIMPAGNSSYPASWLPIIEGSRALLNDWIRGENDYDGYFDYDAAMRDDANPGYLLPGVHIGDGLHPNNTGGQMAAAVVNLVKLTGLDRGELEFKRADISEDMTAQMLAFDPVLPPEDVPETFVQDADGAYWLQLKVPAAKRVQLQINADSFDFQRDGDGIWRLRLPVTGGLHCVHLIIDGTLWLSPYLPIAYGYSRPCNTIALPEENGDFYRLKDVPHGKVIREYFYSSVTGSWESCMVYTPPAYEEESDKIFPVLYLQHGHGENESSWASSGKLSFILDNLLAEGKCVPFVVVMNNGMVQKKIDGKRIVDFTLFDRYLMEDVIPFAEKRYRIGRSKEKRGMAGLSMGSLQTSMTGFRHPEMFCALGIFSGFLHDWIQGSEIDMVKRGPGDDSHLTLLEDKERFDQEFKIFFRAIGDEDPFFSYFKEDDLRCEKAGIRQERRIYSGTHDWNVWRQCIRDFSQLIFK